MKCSKHTDVCKELTSLGATLEPKAGVTGWHSGHFRQGVLLPMAGDPYNSSEVGVEERDWCQLS